MTTTTRERILVVEPDPEIADLVARQSLQPLHYRVRVVGEAIIALQESTSFAPHLIITDLRLPDLSGKDLLAALQSQGGAETPPIIVIADANEEHDIIQAFRLGAADFLLWPMHDTEVVSAVERVLQQVRERRAKWRLSQQLQKANQQLQRRVRELTTLFDLAKMMASVADTKVLFRRLVEGALRLTEADKGWMFLRQGNSKRLVLVAQHGLPRSLATRVGQPWDDGLSSLIMLSGEPLNIYGEPLRRFKIYKLGQSALVMPVKVKKEVIAVLVVGRQEARPFSSDEQALLAAMADYASIALANAQLFRALEERAQTMQRTAKAARRGETLKNELLQSAGRELLASLDVVQDQMAAWLENEREPLTREQQQALKAVQRKLEEMEHIVASMTALQGVSLAPSQWAKINLSDLARLAVNRYQRQAHQKGVELGIRATSGGIEVWGDPEQLEMVFGRLVDNALKFTPARGRVTVHLNKEDGTVHVTVQDTGIGIAPEHLPRVFERFYRAPGSASYRYGGLGLGLSVAKEIIVAHNGRIWVDSQPQAGTTVHFTLPLAGQTKGG